MRKLLKFLMYPWEEKKKRKQKLQELLKLTGFKLIKDSSITLTCFVKANIKNGKLDLYDDNHILLHKGITEEKAVKLMEKYKKAAKQEKKSLRQYIDDLILKNKFDDIKLNYLKTRKSFLAKYNTESKLNQIWRKRIKNRRLIHLKKFYYELIKKHPTLAGKNFAQFNTKIFKNGKLTDEIVEFSNSGPKTIKGFINRITDKDFLQKVKSLDGKSRKNDSEIKYIYHFLKNHLQKGDYFIIETTNIMTACSSCRREILILKEILGDKVRIIVNARDEMQTVDDVIKFLK
ncbi:hypothetical protein [Kordia jejudonensis]|uniref:hypothetical protein n=1 Tax=Kordia jejudonensis TaxID=1348245 RepID=UPI0006293F1B|nr:hypothetical protein [Kordia jejudonensis]